MTRTAIIAGQGRLPAILARRLTRDGAPPLVLSLEGHPPEGLSAESFRLDELGALLTRLRDNGIGRVCFAGAVRRPAPGGSAGVPADGPVARIAAAMGQGDDALLRTVIAVFEEAGLAVVAAQDIAPELVAWSAPAPQGPLAADAARAAAILAALGPLDVAQACVVAGGLCLGIEAIQGTEALLRFVADTRAPFGATGGVLVKRAKPGQDRRIDLPTIGPATVEQAAAAGLSGICVEAGGVLILDPETTAARAAALGLTLWAAP